MNNRGNMDNYLDYMQNNTVKNCYHIPYECEYEDMESVWYEPMVDSLYDTCEEIGLKNWDE